MNSSDRQENDPLDGLLRVQPPADEVGDLRRRVFAKTTPLLVRRRWVRRGGIAAALVGCYLTGVGTVELWHRGAGGGQQARAERSRPVEESDRDQPSADQLADRARQLESVKKATRFDALRHAGDLKLKRDGDVAAAVRYYARALDVATQDELTISARRDTWLLMSLKEARLQEKQHADERGKS